MRKFIALLAFLSFVFLLVGCVPGQTNITLVFETNGGAELDDVVVSLSDTDIVLPTPVKEGYEFEGWYLESDFNTQFSLASLLQSSDTITLYAKWAEVAETTYITVTFDSDDGTEVASQTIVLGGLATEPTAPTKEGHTFGGWYSDLELTTAFVFTTALSEDITLHAKWDVVMLTVTFYDDDETTVLKTESVPYGGAATAPTTTPTKASTAQYSYVFNVWDKAFNNVTTNLSVYATYTQTVRSYTVTFYNDDETTVLKTESVLYGGTATAPTTTPTKASTAQYDYAFDAWDTVFNNITGDLNVYATYTQTVRSYTVTFYNEDRTTILKTETVLYGGTATAPTTNPVKPASTVLTYTFDSWDTTFNNITGDLSVYATYTSQTRYYTVSFAYELGDDTFEFTMDNLEYGDIILQPSMDIQEGYDFDGWYVSDSYLSMFDFDLTVSSNITLYGRYIELISGFTLISKIHETPPTDSVNVKGVVYYIAAGDGFIVRDASGQIYIESSTDSLEIGDLVEISGTLGTFEFADIHFLVATEIAVADQAQVIPDPVTLSLLDISMIDFENWRYFGIDAIVSGTLIKEDGTFMLYDLFSDTMIIFDEQTIPIDTNLDTFVDQRITIGGIIIGLVEEGMTIILFNDYHESPTALVLSEQELLDELIDLANLHLDQSVFLSGETLDPDFLVAPPGYTGVTIAIESFGTNASLFDVDTLTFGIITTQTVIDIRLTATLGLLTETIEIQFILNPASTINDFYNGDDFDAILIEAIIIHIEVDGDSIILADETGILMSHSGSLVLDDLSVGDEILIKGYHFTTKEGQIIMVDPEVFSIVSSDNDFSSLSSSVAEFIEGEASQFYIVSGVLIHKGDFNSPSIIADDTGMFFAFGIIEAVVGDEILIMGLRHVMDEEDSPVNIIFMVGTPNIYLLDIISNNNMEYLTSFKSISEVLDSPSSSIHIVKGIVAYVASGDEPSFIADDTDILLVFGALDAEVGDEVVLLGLYFKDNGIHIMMGIPNTIILANLSSDNDMPLTPTPYTFAELALIDPATVDRFSYIEVTGVLSKGDAMETDFIVSASESDYIMVMALEQSQDVLYAAIGLNVTLRGYLISQYDEKEEIYQLFMGFVNFDGELVIPELTTTEKITQISTYVSSLNLGELRAYDFLDLPTSHPLFGTPILWTPTGDTADYIDLLTSQILNIADETSLFFTVSFTVDDIPTTLDLEYVVYPEALPFEPGYLGAVPTITDTSGENFFPGLYIETISRQLIYEDVTQSYADLAFPFPSDIGAEYYTIEYYDTVLEQWVPILNDLEEPARAEWYGYRVYFEYAVSIRLRAHGDLIGSTMISNVVQYVPSSIDTFFSAWYLDESFELGTAIAPFVGRGLWANTTIYEIGGDEIVGFVTYQWYRVNPYTFEMTAIDGATEQTYVTTLADVGYKMMVKITGDGINVGGYRQLLSYWPTLVPVEFYMTGFSDTGFILHLSHLVDSEDLDALEMVIDYYDDLLDEWIYEELTILSITQLDSAASYYIAMDLSEITDYNHLALYFYQDYDAVITWDLMFFMDEEFFQ